MSLLEVYKTTASIILNFGELGGILRTAEHKGLHPDKYHQYIYDTLITATKGLSGKQYKEAFDKTMDLLSKEVSTVGSTLNRLLNNKE